MTQQEDKNILNFFYEVGMLKRNPRTGWLLAHVKNPESIADHTARSVFIAYILAKMEGVDPKDAALICAFHELGETRLGDLHKLQSAYITEKKVVEKRIIVDQLAPLPQEIRDELSFYIMNEGTDNSPAQIIAKDADYVECAIQAKEYLEQGYVHAQNWIDNVEKVVKTQSAKRIVALLKDSNSQDWYVNLKKIER